ncbi:MAG: acyl-CoA dehydrogenase family protein [Kibdelosporangium sp.]
MKVDLDPAAAAEWDRQDGFPSHVVKQLATAGCFGTDIPPLELGELSARIGGVCSSVRGLLTVQAMVAAALSRWGTAAQRAQWLPALAGGDHIAGFCATELDAGSDLTEVRTRIDQTGDTLTISGTKRWVTCGEIATVYLVLGVLDGKATTVLVEADRPGVTTERVSDQLGMRAARIAHVRFDSVRVPVTNQIAPAGFGLSHVVSTALDHGRFTVAWGCVGMAEACLHDAARHAVRRTQGKTVLSSHQLVQATLARASVEVESARQLCVAAAVSRSDRSPDAIARTVMAKYAAARAAAVVSQNAVQVLGSAGCAPDSRAGRFFRDAKVMQIIEGSDEVSELHIAGHLLRRFARETT